MCNVLCQIGKILYRDILNVKNSIWESGAVLGKDPYEWWKRFKDGQTSTDVDSCSGRLSTSNTNECVVKVSEVLRQNHHLTIRELVKCTHKVYCNQISALPFDR